MRHLLEDLPGALLPDPTRESEDPGVRRISLDDDLVRPVAEEDLRLDAGRNRRSPLARHVELLVAPFEPALPATIGLRLAVEGSRVRSAQMLVGHRHQGIERRAVGLAVDDETLWPLLSAVSPGPVAQVAVISAVEQLLPRAVDEATSRWRELLLELAVIRDAAAVYAAVVRRRPRESKEGRRFHRAADSALAGVAGGALPRFAAILGVRTDVSPEEQATLRRRLDDVEAALDDLDEEVVLNHLDGVAILDAQRARAFGLCGPPLRATGALDDLPLDLGVPGTVPDAIPLDGSAGARLRIRLHDARTSLGRARAFLDTKPPAPRLSDDVDVAKRANLEALHGIADTAVRVPGGTLSCLVEIAAGKLRRLRLRPPELPLLAAVPRTLAGVRLDDVADVIATYGFSATALDR